MSVTNKKCKHMDKIKTSYYKKRVRFVSDIRVVQLGGGMLFCDGRG